MKSPLKIATALSNIIQLYRSEGDNATARDVLAGSFASQIVAYDLPLPSGSVDNSRQWYLDNCSAVAEETLVRINESIVIDLSTAMRRTQAIWELRYNMLHTAGHPSTFAATLAGLTAVGVNDYLSHEFTCIMDKLNTIPSVRDIVFHMNSIEE